MTKQELKAVRKVFINSLDDENGINEKAYNSMCDFSKLYNIDDILDATRSQDNRFYLRENHNVKP